MQTQNPLGTFKPLLVPALIGVGFAYVYWMGYKATDEELAHRILAFFFEFNIATLGAAAAVTALAIQGVKFNLRKVVQQNHADSKFLTMANTLFPLLATPPLQPSWEAIPTLITALQKIKTEETKAACIGPLGAFLGELLRQKYNAIWEEKEDPELGPYSYQASSLLVSQAAATKRIHIFSIALQALENPATLSDLREKLLLSSS